jgi:hypothetical protein
VEVEQVPGGAGTAGTVNTGGGGGGGGQAGGAGGAGGSGIVIVKELNKATGVWSLKSQFSAVKSGTWVQAQCSVH